MEVCKETVSLKVLILRKDGNTCIVQARSGRRTLFTFWEFGLSRPYETMDGCARHSECMRPARLQEKHLP